MKDNNKHAFLVERAGKWLRNSWHCSVVLSERVTWGREIPDAIGFKHNYSVLVECKTSRQDFLNDKKKPFREESNGVGNYRFYLCEPNIINREDLPKGYGLLWCDNKGKVRQIKGFYGNCSGGKDEVDRFEADLEMERRLLLTEIKQFTLYRKEGI